MINICFYINSDDFQKYHRRTEILQYANKLMEDGGSVVVFLKPAFFLKRGNPIVNDCKTNIKIRPLYTLLPTTLALRSKMLMNVFVKLPIYLQTKLHTKGLNGAIINWIYKPDQYLYTSKKTEYVYLQYDNYAMDEGYFYNKNRQYLQTEQAARDNSLLLLFTSRQLLNEYKTNSQIGNGQYYPNAIARELLRPEINDSKFLNNKKIVGFVGKIDQSFDVNLVLHLACHNPEITIVLVGPIESEVVAEKLHKVSNIKTLGFIPYEKLSEQTMNFNVGICPYKQDKFSTYRNPLKVYEYFATGLSVVSTKCDLSEEAQALLYVADTYDDFNEKVKLALSEDTLELATKRLAFAEQNCWDNRVEYVLQTLKNMETAK